VQIREEPYTVVGIMPRGFGFPSPAVQFWIPMAAGERGPGAWNYEVVGRVLRKATPDQATVQLEARTILELARDGSEREFGATLSTLQERLVGDVRPLLLIFMAAVTAVLLIACVNVVNLMLTRATSQEHEHTIRTALGAGPRRLAQQLLTESTVVSLLGAGLGYLLAFALTDVLVALAPGSIPRREEIGMDWVVFSFTLGVALLVGVGICLVPALRAVKIDLVSRLNEGPRGSSGGGRQGRIRDGLVVVQLGLALVLLVSAGLLVKSFTGVLAEETGFVARNVLTFETSLPASRYPSFESRRLFYAELLDKSRALPGVQAAALVVYLPASRWFHSTDYEVEGYTAGPGEELTAEIKQISVDYFATMGISLLEGRAFDNRDDQSAPSVVIVNESMARRYWGQGGAIGERIKLDEEWSTVVGVVHDVRYRGAEREAPKIYLPYAAGTRLGSMDAVLRVEGRPEDLVPTIRQLLASLDLQVTLYGIQPLEDILWSAVAAPRFRTLLLVSFAVLSLLLSVVGVYGVMAYSVEQRTRELGIRMALGAEHSHVVWTVAARGMALTLAGISLGALGAYGAAGVLRSYLYNLQPQDPATFVAAAAALALASLLACCIPAFRATQVDPLIALRAE
jgi:putative ABC transport system permease protein